MRIDGPGAVTTVVDLNSYKMEAVGGQQAEEKPVISKAVAEEQKPANTGAGGPVKQEQLESAVELANKVMEISTYNLQFKIHEESGLVQVKVVDSQTQEVIREIPPEKMLELAASIKEMLGKFQQITGILIDEIV